METIRKYKRILIVADLIHKPTKTFFYWSPKLAKGFIRLGHDMDYLYAISGAKIGLSINGDNDVRIYHSDRLTQYIAGGTFVLAKKVPDTDLLCRYKQHLR